MCAVFAGKTIEDCTRGDEGCICLKERVVSSALDLASKEAAFARTAYDQLQQSKIETRFLTFDQQHPSLCTNEAARQLLAVSSRLAPHTKGNAMTYGEIDLATMERRAYIEGNTHLADLIATFQDETEYHAEALAELQTNCDEHEARANVAEENMLTLKRAIQDRLEEVDRILAECKRISGRKELEAALQAIYNETA